MLDDPVEPFAGGDIYARPDDSDLEHASFAETPASLAGWCSGSDQRYFSHLLTLDDGRAT